jgi:hypothetical protein
MKKNQTDGGYYAIKGFAFQIDKSILEILNADETSSISIEEIQDLSSDGFVMQIKYKETANFIPSKIKEPILQLLKEFQNSKNRNYYLYAHFNKLDDYKNFTENDKINIDNLNQILGNRKDDFETKDKESFISKFFLDFAPDFQTQFLEVIQKLKNKFNLNNDDEAIFYYSIICHFLQNLIVSNKEKKDRECTQKTLLEYVNKNKKIIFTSAFKDYKGESDFIKFVKDNFVKALKHQENYIFFGDNIPIDSSYTLEKLIIDIVQRHYKSAIHDIKPLNFIISNDEKLRSIKKELISNKILFNDGYEHIQFNSSLFLATPIINKKTSCNGKATESLERTSFKLRLLSSLNFNKMDNNHSDMIYYFDSKEVEALQKRSHIKIDGFNTKQINDIFTF